jgi:hypothetical protein
MIQPSILMIRQSHYRHVRGSLLVRSQRRICWTAGVILRIYVTRTSCHCIVREVIECSQTQTYGRLFETVLYRMLDGKEGYCLMLIGR